MFLCIENDGIANISGLTVLGLSSARGKADKIGQFGSGFLHGILTCARQNIMPTIFLGNDRLKFATTSDKMGEKEFQQLLYEFKGEIKELPIALEFGALDWNGLDMGLREFVSNAIDAGGHKVEIVPTAEPSADKTRIFLPFGPDVSKFFSALREKFLHFSPEFNSEAKILGKPKLSPAMLYRKGVFVRQSEDKSLFDYNFGDSTKIDESRNMSEYTIRSHVCDIWAAADISQLKQLFARFGEINDTVFESRISLYLGGAQRKTWFTAFNELYPNSVIADPVTQGQLIAKAEKKGKNIVCVPYNLYTALISAGVPSINTAMDNVDDKGREIKPADNKVMAKVVKIWSNL